MGTAAQKYEAYLNGVEGATSRFKATFEELSQKALDSGTVISFVNAGTKLISGLGTILGLLDKTRYIIATFLALKLVNRLSNGIGLITKLTNISKSFTNTIKLAANATKLQKSAEAALSKQMSFTGQLRRSNLTTQEREILLSKRATAQKEKEELQEKALQATKARTSLIIAGASIAIGAAIGIYQQIQQSQQKVVDNAKESLEEAKEQANTVKDTISQLEEFSKKSYLSTEEHETLLDLQHKINAIISKTNKAMGVRLGYIDIENDSYDEQIEKLERIAQLTAQQEKRQAKAALEAEKEAFGGTWFFNPFEKGHEYVGALTSFLTDVAKAFSTSREVGSTTAELFEKLTSESSSYSEEEQNALDKIKKLATDQSVQVIEDFWRTGDADKAIEAYHQIEEVLTAMEQAGMQESNLYKNLLATYSSDRAKQIEKIIQAYQTAADAEVASWIKTFNPKNLEGKGKEGFVEWVKENVEGAKEYSEEYFNYLYESATSIYPSIQSEAEKANNAIISSNTETKQSYESLKSEVESLTNVYDDLSKIVEEYNSNGYISVENFEKILENYQDYISLLQEENGQLVFNNDTLLRNTAIKIDNMGAERALAYVKQFSGKTDAEVIGIINQKTKAIENNTSALWQNVVAEIQSLALKKETKQAIYEQVQMMNRLTNAAIGSLGRSSSGTSSSGSSAASKQQKTYANAIKYATSLIDKQIDALKKQKEEIEETNEALQKEIDLYDRALSYINKTVDSRIEALEKEKDLLQEKNDEANREIELEELKNNLAKARQRTMRVYYEDKGKCLALCNYIG